MTPEQITMVVISFGLLVSASFSWKSWLRHREQMLAKKSEVEMAQIDLEKQKLMVAAAQQTPVINELSKNLGDLRQELLKKMKEGDTLTLPAGEKEEPLTISGRYASEVGRNLNLSPCKPFAGINPYVVSMKSPERVTGDFKRLSSRVTPARSDTVPG